MYNPRRFDEQEVHVDQRLVKTRELLAQVLPTPMKENGLSDQEKIRRIEEHFSAIMETLGLDLGDESLRDTPRRIAKMYVQEIFSGLDPRNFPKITTIPNDLNYDQMVLVKSIDVKSTCEHHFVTIDGTATVAYIPRDKVIGLSKLNRIVKFFARRPQVQERLTKQIADCLSAVLGTSDVAVHITAKHYCVAQRGVEDANSVTSTNDLRGAFRNDPRTRAEFLDNCRGR
jgi:GTP cyclohydrolase I